MRPCSINIDRINITDLPPLTTAEAAARLRVRPATLYAYVSRGLITRTRTRDGSTYDPMEIERFAARRRRSPEPGAQPGAPLMVLDTAITLIEDDHLYFRGMDAESLALEGGFEQTAAWIWQTQPESFTAPDDIVDVAVAAARTLPAAATPIDRMQVAVAAASAADPLRDDPSPENALRIGGVLLAVFPHVLNTDADADADTDTDSTAAAVLRGLGATPTASLTRVTDIALSMAVDHDLAVSTMAARIAASARASPYSCVSAALGAFHSPLHGTAGRGAASLLRRIVAGEPISAALSATLRRSGAGVPGFGHTLYRSVDPRAKAVLAALADVAPNTTTAVDALVADVRQRIGLQPNLDLAFAALIVAAGLDDDDAAALFGVARTAGWIAHVVEEYAERPMRLRPHGRHIEA